ncbi:MAG: hypothetical protein E7211_21355 [Clostridium lundense]|nr:hypothetical protein [Clostridium lundense]
MSDFSDFKITDNDIAQKGVVAAPDKLTGTAAQNKAIFDRLVSEVVKAKYNDMLTALETDISDYLGESEEARRAAETQRDRGENGYTDDEEVFHNGRVQNETARIAAETARASAESARASAETARVSAESARADENAGIVAQATAKANAAAASEATATEKAALAVEKAALAVEKEASATASAASAAASAASASSDAATASAKAALAESWAVGGTSSRTGEDTNNAYYWCTRAEQAAGGGVMSFNGRNGTVTPQSGDYTAAQVGAYSKAETLDTNARGFLGLASSAVPDDAFVACVLVAKNTAYVHVQVNVNGEPAIAGIKVNGLTTLAGSSPVYTDSDGRVSGMTAASSTTISTENYIDLPTGSVTVSTPIGSVSNVTINLTQASNAEAERTASGTVIFSPYVADADVCCVGGGGGGSCVGSGGGGGGYVSNAMAIAVTPNAAYTVTVGAGGASGTTATTRAGDGGATSFKLGSTTLANANGGQGGGYAGTGATPANGNGNGGTRYGGAGGAGTVRKFGETSGTLFGGGGGGGGSGTTGGAGGSPYGGNGGGKNQDGQNGKGYGGGGGSDGDGVNNGGGTGYQGVCFIRWRYAA